MFAALFLLAIWIDETQPAQSPAASYAFLSIYVVWSAVLVAISWSSWWLEAKMAVPAHVVDIILFTEVVFSTNGYTSPFFLFFVFLLLSSAIRWGWRETSLTAVVLVVLYLTAGLSVAGTGAGFEERRFIIRSGHLLILSAILIWFGIHQRYGRLAPVFEEGDFSPSLSGDDAFRSILTQVMRSVGARSGQLLTRGPGIGAFSGPCMSGNICGTVTVERSPVVNPPPGREILFDLRHDRALTTGARRRLKFGRSGSAFDAEIMNELGFAEGLACAVRTGTTEGWLILGDIDALSADHLALGHELATVAATLIERQELLHAIADNAAAASRLSLARDLHDSVVQFLAGAAFRLEAIRRATPEGSAHEQIAELKELVLGEQGEIRGYVSALRRRSDLELREAIAELNALIERLGQQWSIRCTLAWNGPTASIPIKLHLDLQNLLREAVANSVRHGGADRVAITIANKGEQLQLGITDNGSGFVAAAGDHPSEPWSLKERVERAGGSMMVMSDADRTRLDISLPLKTLQR